LGVVEESTDRWVRMKDEMESLGITPWLPYSGVKYRVNNFMLLCYSNKTRSSNRYNPYALQKNKTTNERTPPNKAHSHSNKVHISNWYLCPTPSHPFLSISLP
jgi:hypothetical protein